MLPFLISTSFSLLFVWLIILYVKRWWLAIPLVILAGHVSWGIYGLSLGLLYPGLTGDEFSEKLLRHYYLGIDSLLIYLFFRLDIYIYKLVTGKHNKKQEKIRKQLNDDSSQIPSMYFEKVAEELELKRKDKGLWLRLYSQNKCDDTATLSEYILLRAKDLYDEDVKQQALDRERAIITEKKNLKRQKEIEREVEKEKRKNAGLADADLLEAVENGSWATASKLINQNVRTDGVNEKGLNLIQIAEARSDQLMINLLKANIPN